MAVAVRALVLVVVAKHGVIGRQDGAAAVAEDRVDAFIGHDLNDGIGAASWRAGRWVSRSASVFA